MVFLKDKTKSYNTFLPYKILELILRRKNISYCFCARSGSSPNLVLRKHLSHPISERDFPYL